MQIITQLDILFNITMFQKNIETNATVSVPAEVLNLTQINNSVSINRLMTAVGLQYLKTIGDNSTLNQGFNYVTPDEHTFPGELFFYAIIFNSIKYNCIPMYFQTITMYKID